MQHSVNEIGKRYAELSDLRKDEKRFNEINFINFAKSNSKKYSLVTNGDDLLVGTWYSTELIEDYRKSL